MELDYETAYKAVHGDKEAQKQQSLMDDASRSREMRRLTELQDFIKSQSGELTGFDEGIAKRLVERIDVMEDSVRLALRSGGSIQITG